MSANAVWYPDSAHKLVTHNFFASGSIYKFSRRMMWIKCSNNNRGNTACGFFKEGINKHAAPLQVRGDKGSEDQLVSKNMAMVRNGLCRGCTGDR